MVAVLDSDLTYKTSMDKRNGPNNCTDPNWFGGPKFSVCSLVGPVRSQEYDGLDQQIYGREISNRADFGSTVRSSMKKPTRNLYIF